MAATFTARAFHVSLDEKGSNCLDGTKLTFDYDLDGYPSGSVYDLTIVSSPSDCNSSCKAGASITLWETP